MMDLSDGLSSDLPKLCQASHIGARIDQQNLPCIAMGKNDKPKFDPLELALHGGDDYELLFTVAKKNIARVPAKIGDARVTRIGEITSSPKIVLVRESGEAEKLNNKGWDLFR